MPISPWVGKRVTAHHPRGVPHITGVVVKAAAEEGRGLVLTLNTGASIVPRDVIETAELPAFYVSTYCNFVHNMRTGAPIKHDCRHIPPAALRLEREDCFTEAIAIMQGKHPCVDCCEYIPHNCTRCEHHARLTGYDGSRYDVGYRVELHPGTDLWMQGARFGTVESVSLTPNDRVKVRLDRLPATLFAGSEDTFRKA
jgi:hypothetical protein